MLAQQIGQLIKFQRLAEHLTQADFAWRAEERRERHLLLMLTLLSEPVSAPAKIERARAMVDMWRRNRTCSEYFIERWQALLALPMPQLVQGKLNLGEWEDALFQNSPWTWAWNSNP